MAAAPSSLRGMTRPIKGTTTTANEQMKATVDADVVSSDNAWKKYLMAPANRIGG